MTCGEHALRIFAPRIFALRMNERGLQSSHFYFSFKRFMYSFIYVYNILIVFVYFDPNMTI